MPDPRPLPRFPNRVDQITPEIIQAALEERNPAVEVEAVRIVETKAYGDGQGQVSTADRVVLDLVYRSGCDAGLPARMVVKTFLEQPHAPRSMYRNEVRFYRNIRPELSIEAPRAFASVIDEQTGQFGVLMEDLRLRDARFPNATTAVTEVELRDLLESLASLHAAFWTSPRLQGDLDWVPTPRSGGMYKTFQTFGKQLVGRQLEHEFKAELVQPLGRSLDQMWDALWQAQAILDSAPVTLLHGDPHVGNTYLLPGGKGGLLDWQLMVKGRWSHDVTYLLVTALDIETRRARERELLAFYLDALASRGAPAPSPDEAFELYRRTVVWGLVIGWLITPPENYGEAITAANVKRLVAAARDLETFEALEAAR